MKLFIDTSSLIKKYIEESGSDELISLDSIQLASVKHSESSKFVTSDKKLFDSAQKELKIETIFIL